MKKKKSFLRGSGTVACNRELTDSTPDSGLLLHTHDLCTCQASICFSVMTENCWESEHRSISNKVGTFENEHRNLAEGNNGT